MPMSETLDLSGNPFGDKIIRMSVDGATDLFEALSDFNYSLKCLSLADNCLGSKVAAPLAKFLGTPINTLHIGEIGLGSDGFHELERRMGEMINIVSMNTSANRDGIEAAKFLAKLLRCAPKLVSVIVADNIMPEESLMVIFMALKAAKVK